MYKSVFIKRCLLAFELFHVSHVRVDARLELWPRDVVESEAVSKSATASS